MNIPFTVSCAPVLSFSILSTQEKPELNKATEPAGKTSVQVTDPALNEMRERVAAIQNLNTTKVHQGNAADAASSSDFYTQNFDALGRVSIKVDQIGTICTMIYDLAGRMTEKQYHTGATPAQGGTITPGGTLESTDTFSYDAASRLTATTKDGVTEARNHDNTDQLTQIAGKASTNDAKGNLTAYEQNGKEYEIDYDLDNRIIKVDIDNNDVEKYRRLVGILDLESKANVARRVSSREADANQYRYDALGRRVIRQEGTTKTALIWWGNSEKHRRLVGVLDRMSGASEARRVKAREASLNQCAEHKHQAGQTVIQNDIMAHPSRLNSVIARAVDGSKFKLEWYHKNYLDHVYAVSDDSGDILEHYRYTAFGEVTIYNSNGNQVATTQIDNHILWNTRRRDEVTGYYLYKFRHYSAELGRWPSRDPIEEEGGINLYGFVGNDPISRWDRLGLAYFETGDSSSKNKFSSFVYQGFPLWQDKERLRKIKEVLKEIGSLTDANGNECFDAVLHYDVTSTFGLWAETALPVMGAKKWVFFTGHGVDYDIDPKHQPTGAKDEQYLIVDDGYVNTNFIRENMDKDTTLLTTACYHSPNRKSTCTSLKAESFFLKELESIRDEFKKDYCKDCSHGYKHLVSVLSGGLSNNPRNGKHVINSVKDLTYSSIRK